MSSNIEVSYVVDNDDLIVDISQDWEAFANDNDAKNLDKANVLGKPLFQYISGDTTRMFVWSLFNNARMLRKQYVKNYRCDSAMLKRYMEMTITPSDNGILEISNRILATEAKKYRTEIVYYQSRIRRCSMCNRLNHNDDWSEADELVETGVLESEKNIYVIYTVCDSCRFQPTTNASLICSQAVS